MSQIPLPNYIATTSLEEYFVNGNTGLPLAAGSVFFYQDTSRTTGKVVYELTGSPSVSGGYTFTSIGDVVQLSATGTFVDESGNNIVVYYNPYDSNGNLELYYIVVKDIYGNIQFTRSAWPQAAVNSSGGDTVTSGIYTNQLSNSQFVEVSFYPATSAVYTFAAAGTFNYQIAPDWFLNVTAAGAGNVTVTRNPIVGGPPLETNPPYTLTIVPGANIATNGLVLRQRLFNNPGIWSQVDLGANGFISASILLMPTAEVTISYVPSTGVATDILTAMNTGSTAAVYNNTVELPVSTNSSAPPTGYVDIYLSFPSSGSGTTFSSVQVVGLISNQLSIDYIQEPVNRQIDHLFHYYSPKLNFKPIPSYLVGWDFPLNPSNVTGIATGMIPTAANKSAYVWDQTIVWTQFASSITYARANTGGLSLTCTGGSTGQFAVIQYLDAVVVRKMLSQNLSVNISANTTQTGGISGVVSLYYTTGTALPNVATGSANSIVATLNSDGSVATFNNPTGATWTQIPRNLLGNISGAFTLASLTSGTFNNIGLSGFGADTTGIGPQNATFFAIVVGFSTLAVTNNVILNSISVVPGDIPTVPAPQTPDEVIRECQRYIWRTYAPTAVAGATTLIGAQAYAALSAYDTAANKTAAGSFGIRFPVAMRTSPVITFYSPNNGSSGNLAVYNQILTAGSGSSFSVNLAITLWSSSSGLGYLQTTGAYYDVVGTQPVLDSYISSSRVDQSIISYHLVVNAQLGIV